ncbi:ATP-binding SpoIIE family protein phosphatase [Streptomyces sp. CRN 30]|uniref:ATP-binding SpoIIE family protein phosphatase n=1 Tax=Streptomyces sp. CRN 30 TaxID=3075613 RepID=UPI002A82945F|nr:ATP-binding SpoIIE family protein phosphatase [Streptomyces sp. CRN 30]
MSHVREVPVHGPAHVRDVRVAAEAAAARAGLDGDRTADAALVATELATNLLEHAGGGRVLVDTVDSPLTADGSPARVQVVAVDHGPGIRDVAAALRDGFSTTSSLGAGLGTCRRVADDFSLHSLPGHGTVVMARIGDGRDDRADADGPGFPVRAGGVNIPFAGAEHSGDAWAFVRSGDRVTLMLADGLGHGPDAARASSAAVEALRRSDRLPPAELLRRLDGALRGTRGAAVAVAQLDLAARLLRFAGVGNIGARLRTGDGWRSLPCRPGIVGAHRPAAALQRQVDWADDCLLVLHSDGLPGDWSPGPAVHHPSLDPAVIAAVIVRDASSPARPVRDDIAVAVLSPSSPPEPSS